MKRRRSGRKEWTDLIRNLSYFEFKKEKLDEYFLELDELLERLNKVD
ncbi:hypothetical protein JOC86_003561 [Bacillus pakistanensis]|uniref:Uncharacterized protein n=1 Tax=Rossellomorea pakistanensis TaxID=992288 RepID=A0ABS2NGQ1_9BACI|nr:hypothetical protein [Bacillus pakistanensis]MBM7587009.1 hypothetical protein [Bacillus pakistanensis]